MDKNYRIITFDGGGVRGALTVNLLNRLCARVPSLLRQTDMLAGTSTGALIALCLAYGVSPEKLLGLYSQYNAQYIFAAPNRGITKPKYKNHNLKRVISSVFPAYLRLKDLKKTVLIPAFKLCQGFNGKWRPVFFSNFPQSETRDEYVVDVAMASTAAPVYFPSHNNYIDGGVIANNPCLAALASAVDQKMGGQQLHDIRLLSIGTGETTHRIGANTDHWGALQWALYGQTPFPLLSILLNGVEETDTHLSKQLLGNFYFRLNPHLPSSIALDKYQAVPLLTKLAKRYSLTPTTQWLKSHWIYHD